MFFFVLKRMGVMALTMLVLTFIVFIMVNLDAKLETLAKNQGNMRMTDAQVENWLSQRGYREPTLLRYGEWLGALPAWTGDIDGQPVGRCVTKAEHEVKAEIKELRDRAREIRKDTGERVAVPRFNELFEDKQIDEYCGLLQGYFGSSTRFQGSINDILPERLGYTGILMFWVMLVMVPSALIIGVLAGMREGSTLDRSLSVGSIASTSAPEYVTGIIFTVIFASWLGIFSGSASSATSARGDGVTFYNFTLPVITMAIYGIGYIARMTRASMAEVMTSQYIRTARLKGMAFRQVVMKHALRNALIAPFTVIMLQFPWLLTGVVIVESMFNYKGFGWMLVEGANNNDIDLVLSASIVAVAVVLTTQLISDIGYAYLNPRIRVR